MNRKILIISAVLLLAGSILCLPLEDVNAASDGENVEACFTISPENPEVGQEITFDASCTSSAGMIVDYAWDFQDDDLDDKWMETVSWTYDEPGDYMVELWVEDSEGNTDKVWKEVNVKSGSGEGATSPEEDFLDFSGFLSIFGLAFGLFLLVPIFLLLIGILIAIWVYKDAEARGESGVLWLLVVLVTNFIGLIVWLVVRPEKKEAKSRRESKPKTETKYCTNCGSENQAGAKYCNECGEEF